MLALETKRSTQLDCLMQTIVEYILDGKHSFKKSISCFYLSMNNKYVWIWNGSNITTTNDNLKFSLGLTLGSMYSTRFYLDMIFTSRLSHDLLQLYMRSSISFSLLLQLPIEFGKPQRYRVHSHPESQNAKLLLSNFQNLIFLCTWEFSFFFTIYQCHYCVTINSSQRQEESFYLLGTINPNQSFSHEKVKSISIVESLTLRKPSRLFSKKIFAVNKQTLFCLLIHSSSNIMITLSHNEDCFLYFSLRILEPFIVQYVNPTFDEVKPLYI